jgi:hypothetical protein
MTIRVPANATKADIDKIFDEISKNKKEINKIKTKLSPKDFIGKFPFEGDSLAFQRDLR